MQAARCSWPDAPSSLVRTEAGAAHTCGACPTPGRLTNSSTQGKCARVFPHSTGSQGSFSPHRMETGTVTACARQQGTAGSASNGVTQRSVFCRVCTPLSSHRSCWQLELTPLLPDMLASVMQQLATRALKVEEDTGPDTQICLGHASLAYLPAAAPLPVGPRCG